MARVLTVQGRTDGLRFGEVSLGSGLVRRYTFDRYTGSTHLFKMAGGREITVPELDENAERVALAESLLRARIGLVAWR